ncbi:unnamed protein product [Brassica rapa]|uniref:DUF7610 domain-containing protein n=1 Tax=Brassica campestris TaxID=3711 RepID=A0A3P5Z2Z0_BRACM|nr:unnamed protein product [Brassica rapa]VDC66568.1 unnamed protein product [Brassica rapa]
MKKQTNTNSVLEKKLEELENLSESLIFNEDDPRVYRDIELRVIFAKTLLAAEISSRPNDTEGEEGSEERVKFACMAKRLTELEEAFTTNRFSGRDDESLDNNDGVGDGEAGSVVSWVNSCQEELDKAEEEKEEEEEKLLLFQDASSEEKKGDEDDEQWPLFQDASSEEKTEVTFPAVPVKEEVVVRDVKDKRRFGFMDLICFGLMGVIITLLLGYIGDITEEDPFLTPT